MHTSTHIPTHIATQMPTDMSINTSINMSSHMSPHIPRPMSTARPRPTSGPLIEVIEAYPFDVVGSRVYFDESYGNVTMPSQDVLPTKAHLPADAELPACPPARPPARTPARTHGSGQCYPT